MQARVRDSSCPFQSEMLRLQNTVASYKVTNVYRRNSDIAGIFKFVEINLKRHVCVSVCEKNINYLPPLARGNLHGLSTAIS